MQKQLVINYLEVEPAELQGADRQLLEAAKSAAADAYAPYSHFRVGAAVLLADGTIVKGNNQENIASPSGLCAERTALFAASSANPGTPVEAVAVVAINPQGRYVAALPCGACRQAMSEYESLYKKPIRTIAYCNEHCVRLFGSVADLLPFAFDM